MVSKDPNRGPVPAKVDVVIVGAGFGGMHMLHRLRNEGFSVVSFETASDVGGTWYWNNYPGARCDIDSAVYHYWFNDDVNKDWRWPERFSAQPEIFAYAKHAADKMDLRKDIRFNTRVTSAKWNEDTLEWQFETDQGDRVSARYFISAVGCLSAARLPDYDGLDDFKGEWYHTGRWPHEKVDFTGKRVVQIGTGSSGIQAAPVIAKDAAHLSVLQRTPQFSVPAQNCALTDEMMEQGKVAKQAMREMMQSDNPQPFFALAPKATFDDTPEQRQAHYEAVWAQGGAGMMMAYNDIMTDEAANEEVANFVRGKIREIVKDPETAELLCPTTYPFATKRICVDTGYFDTFNRDNVSLVDIKSDPIDRITAKGVRLKSGRELEADMIVFATGFDAMTGPIFNIDIAGTNGQKLRDKWEAGPRTYLGVTSEGFPNMFMLTGPGSPSVLSNVIFSNEQHVGWVADFLVNARAKGAKRIEAERASEDEWTNHVSDFAAQTLYLQAESWYLGANVPGKPRVFMPYVGGNAVYQKKIDEVASNDYAGFQIAV